MANVGKINLNNGDSVLKRFETEAFPEEVARLQMSESGTGEVTITDENIGNNAKLVADMFDEANIEALTEGDIPSPVYKMVEAKHGSGTKVPTPSKEALKKTAEMLLD